MHLVVNGWFWGQWHTGSGQYLHHLAEALPPVTPDVALTLVLPSQGQEPTAPPAGWQVIPARLPASRLSANLAKVWFEQVGFPAVCRRLTASLAWTPYWGSAWQQPCHTAVTVHDLIPQLLPAYRGGPAQRLYTSLVSQTARRADVILTDSQASRQDIIVHLSLPAQRVHAVPLAVSEQFCPVVDAAELARVRAAYALPERFFLYLGGFDVRKNLAGLAQGYARFRQQVTSDPKDFGRPFESEADLPRLVIAGRLPTSDTPFTPDPRRLAAEAGVAPWTDFIGWVDEADKPALHSLAVAFVFPSRYEGFGLPAAEAAACGAPVITSNRSSLPEAAPTALLVDPDSPPDLARALQAVLARPRPAPLTPRRTWADVARETAQALLATR